MRAPRDQMAGNEVSKRNWHVGRLVPLAVAAILLLVAWWAGLLDFVSLSSLIRHRETLAVAVADRPFAAPAVFFLIYAVLVAVSFPGASLLTVVSGLLFGWLLGGCLSVLGATAGALAIFLIARTSFGDFLQRRAGPFIAKMVDGFNRDAFHYLLFLRLTPVFPFWVINIVPALLNMRLGPYALATLIGIIPATFAYAYVGTGLDSLIAAQERANPGCAHAGTCKIDPSALVTREMVIALVVLAVMAILPVLIRHWRARRSGS